MNQRTIKLLIYISRQSRIKKKKIPDDCGTKDNNPALIVVADLSPCPRTNKDRYRWRRCTAASSANKSSPLHSRSRQLTWCGNEAKIWLANFIPSCSFSFWSLKSVAELFRQLPYLLKRKMVGARDGGQLKAALSYYTVASLWKGVSDPPHPTLSTSFLLALT